MHVKDFDFDLPDGLIAHYPTEERSASRLMYVNGQTQSIEHFQFKDILQWLNPGDLLVFNDTKVIPARLFGEKSTGGKLEVLIERLIDEHHALAHIRCSNSPKAGTSLKLEKAVDVTVIGRGGANEELFKLYFDETHTVLQWLEQYGHIPLPPYIERPDEISDKDRYQTIFARREGAVAAPTAGLHFDEKLIQALNNKAVNTAYITLHVGAGTFQPVRVDSIYSHRMHSEYIEVSAETCEKIHETKRRGGRVIAIGTTVVRALESASEGELVVPYYGDTDIFIYPGYRFMCVDALLTNFHLPQSTLLMLVSAFAGKALIEQAYQAAVEQQYRFFSYGDAMFIDCKGDEIEI